MCAHQYTFFYKMASHTAFHTDARSSEATLPAPRAHSFFTTEINRLAQNCTLVIDRVKDNHQINRTGNEY
jgi:hypothetical protein